MARKQIELKITDRDNEYDVRITEMSAIRLQLWLLKAIRLLAESGTVRQVIGEVSDPTKITPGEALSFLKQMNLDDLVTTLLSMDSDKAEALMLEMLACCEIKTSGGMFRLTAENVERYISDVRTLFRLEFASVKLHFDFLLTGIQSDSQSSPTQKTDQGTRQPKLSISVR